MLDMKSHWEKVFTRKSSHEVSWYKPRLETSLRLIERAGIPKPAAIIDVGGGDSALVDGLLQSGYSNITVLDISLSAMERAQSRLGHRASAVKWLNADITQVNLPANSYDLWHDRAMFHFLVDSAMRDIYIHTCRSAVKPAGSVIIATFAPDGPEQCSGLPTMRYSPEDLQHHLGPLFRLVESIPELHTTPAGKQQSFVYCMLKKSGS